MPEIKVQPRQVGQPSAPDISSIGQVYRNVSDIVMQTAKAIGNQVEATRKLEANAFLNHAENELTKDYIIYKNDPNINTNTLLDFQEQINARADEFALTAPMGTRDEIKSSLTKITESLELKALDDTLGVQLKNEIRGINLTIGDLQDKIALSIHNQDFEQAESYKLQIQNEMAALMLRGATAEQIENIGVDTEAQVISSATILDLQNAPNEQTRIQIMRNMLDSPETRVNEKAITKAYKEFNRLNALYKESEDLSVPYANTVANESYKNLNLSAKESDALVNIISKNVMAQADGPESYREIEGYTALPKLSDINLVSTDVDRFMVQAAAISLEQGKLRVPTIRELAIAHVLAGAKNATEFPKMANNMLMSGDGIRANEAVEAITYALAKNGAAVQLDKETSAVYSTFKALKDAGNTNYDEMIARSRSPILNAKGGAKSLSSIFFNNTYSLTPKGFETLNKDFKNELEADAIATGSYTALQDFRNIYAQNFEFTEGNKAASLDMTKREMERVYAQDRFSETSDELGKGFYRYGFGVINPLSVQAGGRLGLVGLTKSDFKVQKFAPTKTMAPLSENQIQNIFMEQIVAKAEGNKNIVLPKEYSQIKTASEEEKMTNNLAFGGAPYWSVENSMPNQSLYMKQVYPGLGEIEGRVYFKPSKFMDASATGRPLYEVWMQDSQGRPYPVLDQDSPYNNVMTVVGMSASEFAPEYTEKNFKTNLENYVNESLEIEARSIAPRVTLTPITNAAQRRAYKKDLDNLERKEKEVKRSLGIGVDKSAKDIEGVK